MPSREEKAWQRYEADRVLRKVRKETRHNRKLKRVRRKDWNSYDPDNLDAFDEPDLSDFERIMPRGEQERRQANLKRALAIQQEEDDPLEEPGPQEPMQLQQGVVIEISSSLCRVDLGERTLLCSVRGSLSAKETGYTHVVAVGDRVMISENGLEHGVVEAILPRRSILARPDLVRPHLHQVIVANADQLLIVASWREPHIWLELIDRYLIAVQRYNLQPLICVNKVDLADDEEALRSTLRPYQDLGYQMILSSALTGEGVGKLRKALADKTTVLAGLSGVGKSSLLSAVQPGLQLRIGEVSEQSREGRHTTTQVVMHRLDVSGFVIDTPGIREFDLSGLRQRELAGFYPEISAVAVDCRFDDCTHIHEPGCAVKLAVEQDRISAMRYDNYVKIYVTL